MKNGLADGIHYWYYPSDEEGKQILKMKGTNAMGKKTWL